MDEKMIELFLKLWYFWLLIILIFVYGLYKAKIKGFLGEKTISVILTRLDPSKYKVINDLMLSMDGRTSQIDHVVVSNYGIFVIETKNYKGWIMGDEYGEYWTQVIYKRKEKLYNLVRQNYGHIQALKEKLQEFQEINFIPIIVFSVDSDLKVKTKTDVIYSVNLLKTIRRYNIETVTNDQKEAIYSKLVSLNVREKEIRSQHIDGIKKIKSEKIEQTKLNICPKCGGQLVLRKGKYGEFKGCSDFPNCKYTIKQSDFS